MVSLVSLNDITVTVSLMPHVYLDELVVRVIFSACEMKYVTWGYGDMHLLYLFVLTHFYALPHYALIQFVSFLAVGR